jgi:predicted esterase
MTFMNRDLLLTRVLPAAVALLLLGRCGLSACDRPQFLGLAWSKEGASLSSAERVLIFLHGFQGSGSDVEWFAEDVLGRASGANLTLVLPDGPYSYSLGRAWWVTNNPAERADSQARVLKLIDKLVSRGVSLDRIYVGGFSQGAAMALDVAQASPGLGGAVFLSGCNYQTGPLPEMRVFVGHGRADSICSFSGGASLVSVLEEQGRAVTFFPYKANHELTEELRAAVAQFLAEGLSPQ